MSQTLRLLPIQESGQVKLHFEFYQSEWELIMISLSEMKASQQRFF